MSAVSPFQSAVGISKLGLTACNIAAVYTAQQLIFIMLKPTIGYITDYLNGVKAAIVGLTVLSAVFSLFIIIIPNSDMPGLKRIQFPSLTRHVCDFCIYQEDNEVTSQQYLEEDTFRQVLFCFENSKKNYLSIGCSSKHFRMVQASCNPLHYEGLEENNSDDAIENNIFLVRPSLKYSQNYILCNVPEAFLHNEKFSASFKKYCFIVPKSEIMVLEKLFVDPSTRKVNCDGFQDNEIALSEEEYDAALSVKNFRTYQFWLYAVCLLVVCISDSSLFTISDTTCYESVEGVNYARQRAWGAISSSIFAPFAGFLNDYTESYFAAWCLMMLLFATQLWNLSKMNLVKPDFSQNAHKSLKALFSSSKFIAFEAGIFMNAVFTGVIWFYHTWFLLDIGGNKLVIGLSLTFQCFLGELPAMMFSDWLIKKLGHFNLVSLAIFCHGARFFIYSCLYNPWWVLPVEFLHGLTYGSFYPAKTSFAKLNSQPGTEATTKSSLCTTYEALGKSEFNKCMYIIAFRQKKKSHFKF